MPTKFIGVTSFGIGGVGKSTISLALALEFSRIDLTMLFDSSHIYKLLKSSTITDLAHARIYGNLIVLGIEEKKLTVTDEEKITSTVSLPYVDRINSDMINTMKVIVEVVGRRLKRDVKFVIIDFPNYIEDPKSCFKNCDILVVVLRPYLSILKEIIKMGKFLKIEDKVITLTYVINMWPGKLKLTSKEVKKIFGVDPEELKDLDIITIPELDVVKNERSPLAVVEYIVKKGYLRPLVEKILEIEGIKEVT